jgi:hypothetical protein
VEVRGGDVFGVPLEQLATAAADSAIASAAEVRPFSMIGTFLGYPRQSAKGRLNPR